MLTWTGWTIFIMILGIMGLYKNYTKVIGNLTNKVEELENKVAELESNFDDLEHEHC